MLAVVARALNAGPELPGAHGVRTLREERNLVQHAGTPRAERAIERGAAAVEKLLTFIFPLAFATQFPTLTARQLVANPHVGGALDEGERSFAHGKWDAAIACAGLAFSLADSTARSSWAVAFPSPRLPLRPYGAASNAEIGHFADRIREQVERLEKMLATIAFGYDIVELARFRQMLDRRVATINDSLKIRIVTQRDDGTEEDARYCLDFAAFHAARLERRS